MVHEATFCDDEQERALETRHSTSREAARVAREAAVRRLVLTHVSSRHDVDTSSLLAQARDEFKGPLEVAHDGLTVEIPLSTDFRDPVRCNKFPPVGTAGRLG